MLTGLFLSVREETDTEGMLLPLTLLAEILASITLPGSIELISRLLETLNAVVQYASTTQGDFSFLEQILMSAVENVADKVSVSLASTCQAAFYEMPHYRKPPISRPVQSDWIFL